MSLIESVEKCFADNTLWKPKKDYSLQKAYERHTKKDESFKNITDIEAYKWAFLKMLRDRSSSTFKKQKTTAHQESTETKSKMLTFSQLVAHYGSEAVAKKHKEFVEKKKVDHPEWFGIDSFTSEPLYILLEKFDLMVDSKVEKDEEEDAIHVAPALGGASESVPKGKAKAKAKAGGKNGSGGAAPGGGPVKRGADGKASNRHKGVSKEWASISNMADLQKAVLNFKKEHSSICLRHNSILNQTKYDKTKMEWLEKEVLFQDTC